MGGHTALRDILSICFKSVGTLCVIGVIEFGGVSITRCLVVEEVLHRLLLKRLE